MPWHPPHPHQPRRQIPHRIRTTPSGLDNGRINKPSTTCAQAQAREHAQIRAIKDSIGHVEVFQMDGVGTPSSEDLDPYPATTRPTPPTTPTPSNAKSRYYTVFYRTVSTGWTCEFCENTVLSLQFDTPHDLTYTVNKQYT